MNKLDSLVIKGRIKATKLVEGCVSKKKDGLETIEAVALLAIGVGIVFIINSGVITSVKAALADLATKITSMFSGTSTP